MDNSCGSSVFEILCLRHGKTNYTGIFPDLTPDGEAEVRQVAKDSVLPWVQKHNIDLRELYIASSPAPRAHGTAAVVAEVIKHQGSLIPRIEIGSLVWRDYKRAFAACNGLSGKGYINYETEPVFADPTIFETPSEVRTRWYAFLSRYISDAFHLNRRHTILVSHYEVLCNLVHDLFGVVASEETALRHVEPIFLSVSLCDPTGLVLISGTFRGKEAIVVFDLLDHSIEHQCR